MQSEIHVRRIGPRRVGLGGLEFQFRMRWFVCVSRIKTQHTLSLLDVPPRGFRGGRVDHHANKEALWIMAIPPDIQNEVRRRGKVNLIQRVSQAVQAPLPKSCFERSVLAALKKGP